MNALELVTFARRLLSDQRNRVFASDAAVFEHANAAYEKLMSEFMSWDVGYGLMDPYYEVDFQKPTSPSVRTEYKLPPFFESVKEISIHDSRGAHAGFLTHQDQNMHGSPDQLGLECSLMYFFRNRKLVVDHRYGHGLTSTSGAKLRIEYYRSPARLVAVQLASATSNTAVLGSTPYENQGTVYAVDDYYNGCDFEIVQGTGIGQVFTCEDYDGTTRTITLPSGDTFATTPDSTSVIAMVPCIPDRAHNILAYMTARDGARIEENVSMEASLQSEINDLVAKYKKSLALRQHQTPRTAHEW